MGEMYNNVIDDKAYQKIQKKKVKIELEEI